MDKKKMIGVIEAILFTMGESVEIAKLAEVLDTDKKEILVVLEEMKLSYEEEERGISLIFLENAVQLCTKPELYEYLIKMAKNQKTMTLTDSVIETLSIVAYKQPVTKLDIERIRGVSCEYAMNKLMEYDLVREVGRMDAPGRPMLFGTTEQFLRSFGVQSLEQLPQVNPVQVEEFREQAEAEAKTVVDI